MNRTFLPYRQDHQASISLKVSRPQFVEKRRCRDARGNPFAVMWLKILAARRPWRDIIIEVRPMSQIQCRCYYRGSDEPEVVWRNSVSMSICVIYVVCAEAKNKSHHKCKEKHEKLLALQKSISFSHMLMSSLIPARAAQQHSVYKHFKA